jgi:hypothetical protein
VRSAVPSGDGFRAVELPSAEAQGYCRTVGGADLETDPRLKINPAHFCAATGAYDEWCMRDGFSPFRVVLLYKQTQGSPATRDNPGLEDETLSVFSAEPTR